MGSALQQKLVEFPYQLPTRHDFEKMMNRTDVFENEHFSSARGCLYLFQSPLEYQLIATHGTSMSIASFPGPCSFC